MSNAPADWGDTANHAGSSSSTAAADGIWLFKVVINVRTAITQVGLPYYNRTNPQQGSKQTRESILKLLCGMNNDVQALNYRSDIKMSGEKDQYYPAAPAWSTLSGGNNPTHICTPAQICEWLLDAIKCVPSVRAVEIYMLQGAAQTLVTLDEVRARDITMVPVPYLPVANSFSAPNAGAAEERARVAEAATQAAEAAAMTQSTAQAGHIAELQKKFDDQAKEFKLLQEQIKAMATTSAADPKPADSTATAAADPSTPKRAAPPATPKETDVRAKRVCAMHGK